MALKVVVGLRIIKWKPIGPLGLLSPWVYLFDNSSHPFPKEDIIHLIFLLRLISLFISHFRERFDFYGFYIRGKMRSKIDRDLIWLGFIRQKEIETQIEMKRNTRKQEVYYIWEEKSFLYEWNEVFFSV